MARFFKGSQFYLPPTRLSTNGMNHLPSQPKLVLIYGPRREGRPGWTKHHHAEFTNGSLPRNATWQKSVISDSDQWRRFLLHGGGTGVWG